jgi:hypothetical protein
MQKKNVDKNNLLTRTFCRYCRQDINDVLDKHEKYGHAINHEYRYEFVPHDEFLCEDCRDDILEDMIS